MMNRYELALFLLILVLGLAGGFYFHRHYGAVGFLAGFLGGAFLLPLCIGVGLKVSDMRRARKKAGA